jgi:co-chaperonin GroES (HSP10)
MKYAPLGKYIIVERIEGEKVTASGIVLKTSQEPDTTKVLAVGSEVDEVNVGDQLLVDWNKSVKLENETYRVHIDSVVGVFEK